MTDRYSEDRVEFDKGARVHELGDTDKDRFIVMNPAAHYPVYDMKVTCTGGSGTIVTNFDMPSDFLIERHQTAKAAILDASAEIRKSLSAKYPTEKEDAADKLASAILEALDNPQNSERATAWKDAPSSGRMMRKP